MCFESEFIEDDDIEPTKLTVKAKKKPKPKVKVVKKKKK